MRKGPCTNFESRSMERVKIKYINDKKGHGIIALQAIEAGTVLFEESPIVCAQYLYNKVYQHVSVDVDT